MGMRTWCVLWPRLSFFWLFILYCCSLGDCRHCSILLGRSVIMQDQLCSLQAKVDFKSIFYVINCWATVTLTGTEFQVSHIEYEIFLLQSFLAFSETYSGLDQAVGNTQGLLRVQPFSRYLPYLTCPYWKITVYSHFELHDLDSFLHIAHYKSYLACFHLAWILLSLKAYFRICSLSLFHIQVSLL